MNKRLETVGSKNGLLTGRNIRHKQDQGGAAICVVS